MGDEWPCGRSSFQIRFFAGPNSVGRSLAAEIPEPFGPRKRDHSSCGANRPDAAVASARASRNLSAMKPPVYAEGRRALTAWGPEPHGPLVKFLAMRPPRASLAN